MHVKPEAQKRARHIRQTEGWSVNRIADHLGVSKSSVSGWVRDVPLKPEHQTQLRIAGLRFAEFAVRNAHKLREKHAEVRRQWRAQGAVDASHGDLVHAQGCMLYWAEGRKDKNTVRIGNADTAMMKLFVCFLRDFFGVPDTSLAIDIRGYAANGKTPDQLASYWRSELQVSDPKRVLVRMDSDKRVRSGKRSNVHTYGIADVTLCSTEIAQRIRGAIQFYGSLPDGDW